MLKGSWHPPNWSSSQIANQKKHTWRWWRCSCCKAEWWIAKCSTKYRKKECWKCKFTSVLGQKNIAIWSLDRMHCKQICQILFACVLIIKWNINTNGEWIACWGRCTLCVIWGDKEWSMRCEKLNKNDMVCITRYGATGTAIAMTSGRGRGYGGWGMDIGFLLHATNLSIWSTLQCYTKMA